MDTHLHLSCPHCSRINRLPQARLGAQPSCGVCKGKLLGGPPIALDEAGFDRYLSRNDLPVVVDFWAAWCGPCKMMAPNFAELATRRAGRVLCAKLDTDGAPGIAARYAIRSIPTLIVFDHGAILARQAGALDLGRLLAFVDEALSQRATVQP